jgi:RNA recognition motif-containing protein
MDADGRKRGFGFVTMASSEAAKNAADTLRSADLRGRRLVVNLAHPKGERPARPEGGGGGGGGGFAPFPPAFGGAPTGPPHRKLAPHEEKRKRSFEDGGGPRKKKSDRDEFRGGRVIDYDKDED